MPFKYKNALITGGSSGIGLELAYDLAKLDVHLFLVALDQDGLTTVIADLKKNFPNLQIHGKVQDLSEGSGAEAVYRYCQENDLDIDLLINNAGFGSYGHINDTRIDKEMKMLRLHIMASYHLTRLFLPGMIKENHGCIVNVSSISAFQPNPRFSTYGASKSFLLNWTRAMAEDFRMQKLDIQAIAVCPTPVRTRFQQSAEMMHSTLYDSWMTVNPELISRATIKAIKKNQKIIVPGKLYHYINKFTSRLPMSWKVLLSRLHLGEKDV